LKWEETTTTLNAGLDYGFFNNRINGSVDCKNDEGSVVVHTNPSSLVSNYDNYNIGTIEIKESNCC
jgi:iron complex outermembrane receptor protein